jgi:hypothetical protein
MYMHTYEFMHLFLLDNFSICPRWQDLAIICTGRKRPFFRDTVVAGALPTPSLLRGGSEIAREIPTASSLLNWRDDRFV